MTNEEAKKMLEAKLKCLIAETSGTNYDCNMRLCEGCALNYEQGNMGEQKQALDMAIKALEPYEDYISRADAIKIIKEHPSVVGNRSTIIQKIVDLPSVTPKARWIPVSEREAKYPCLACDKYGQIFIPIGVVTIDGHSYDGLHFEFDAEKFLKGYPREIMAWMPLPQPYKAESEGE